MGTKQQDGENPSKTETDNVTNINKGNQSESEDKESGAPSSAGIADNIGDIASDLAGNMPEIQEHAVQEENKKAHDSPKEGEPVDTDGRPFDPAIHKTDKHGKPTLTKLGKLVKKPGRKAGGASPTNNSTSRVSSKVSQEHVDHQKMVAQARATGTFAANALIGLGVQLGGDEWRPQKNEEYGIDERANLENAFSEYMIAKGISDIPPGVALTIAIGGYMLPRFTMPKTQKRVGTLRQKITQWWINRKLAKKNMKAEVSQKGEGDSDEEKK